MNIKGPTAPVKTHWLMEESFLIEIISIDEHGTRTVMMEEIEEPEVVLIHGSDSEGESEVDDAEVYENLYMKNEESDESEVMEEDLSGPDSGSPSEEDEYVVVDEVHSSEDTDRRPDRKRQAVPRPKPFLATDEAKLHYCKAMKEYGKALRDLAEARASYYDRHTVMSADVVAAREDVRRYMAN